MPDEPAPAPEIKIPKPPRSPWFRGFIQGVLASAVVAAAGYLLTPSGDPHLMFKVSPSRSVVVAKSEVGGLRVLHGDQEIQGDVTAVQVVLWNDGHGPLRFGSVLEPVRIVTDPPTPILVAKVQRTTRPLTEISLDTSSLASGNIPVRFRIMEKGDGALIQLVYAGPPSVGIRAVGVLEGQREVETVTKGTPDAPRRVNPTLLLVILTTIFLGVTLSLTLDVYYRGSLKSGRRQLRKAAKEAIGFTAKLAALGLGAMALYIAFTLFAVFVWQAISPPPPFPL